MKLTSNVLRKIKDAISDKNIDQKTLCEITGISPGGLSAILHKRSKSIRDDNASSLADALGIDFVELFFLSRLGDDHQAGRALVYLRHRLRLELYDLQKADQTAIKLAEAIGISRQELDDLLELRITRLDQVDLDALLDYLGLTPMRLSLAATAHKPTGSFYDVPDQLPFKLRLDEYVRQTPQTMLLLTQADISLAIHPDHLPTALYWEIDQSERQILQETEAELPEEEIIIKAATNTKVILTRIQEYFHFPDWDETKPSRQRVMLKKVGHTSENPG